MAVIFDYFPLFLVYPSFKTLKFLDFFWVLDCIFFAQITMFCSQKVVILVFSDRMYHNLLFLGNLRLFLAYHHLFFWIFFEEYPTFFRTKIDH